MKYHKGKLLLSLLLSAMTFNCFAEEFTMKNGGANFLIMADPQAWRMGQGADSPDPNSSSTRGPWESFNKKVVDGINSKALSLNVRMGIINGDVTEFGRPAQFSSFVNVYDRLLPPTLWGLGNHDYEYNINDCSLPESLAFSSNACAYHMLDNMDEYINLYRDNFQLSHFSADSVEFSPYVTRGSQAYSWDYATAESGTQHFVQLHLGPTYRVFINNTTGGHNYDITDSLSWLRYDLDHARMRGVNHIFVNFHALEWIDKASGYEKEVLKAIFDEYKVSAVFVGHTHVPALNYHKVFGKVPVYTTGALYSGYFDILNVKHDSFQVQSYQVKDGKTVMVKERAKVAKPELLPTCYKHGVQIPVGGIVRSELIPDESKTFILRQYNTSNALDANADGDVYTNAMSTTNPYMRWKLQYLSTGSDNQRYYKVIHVKDNKVLDGDKKGNIYTKEWNNGPYQQWELMKYSVGGIIQLRSKATGRILDANAGREVYGRKDPLKFTNNYQNWELTDLQGKSIPNVRYFKAKTVRSYTMPLPTDTQSDAYWEYAGKKGTALAAPCR